MTRRPDPTEDRLRDLWVGQYGATVALARLLGAADPEDLAQDAFARLYPKLHRLPSPDAARAYLRTIVVNLARSADARRRRGRALMSTREASIGALSAGRTGGRSAEEDALSGLSSAQVIAALAALSHPQREAIVLRYWLDLSVDQIAAAMNVPVGTAKSHLSRAMQSLRTEIFLDAKEDSRD